MTNYVPFYYDTLQDHFVMTNYVPFYYNTLLDHLVMTNYVPFCHGTLLKNVCHQISLVPFTIAHYYALLPCQN